MKQNVYNPYEHIDELDVYFNDVKRYNKRLTKDEEYELARKIQKGDKRALNQLVKYNLRFVVTIAKKYRFIKNVSFIDLISEGNLGLVKAAERFDPEKGVRFSTFAVWWIRAAILEYIRKLQSNMDTNCFDNESMTMVIDNKTDLYKISDEYNSSSFLQENRERAIQELIKCLEQREQQVILMSFGINDEGREHNLSEISDELHLTTERIRQIKDEALVKLRCCAVCSSEFNAYKALAIEE